MAEEVTVLVIIGEMLRGKDALLIDIVNERSNLLAWNHVEKSCCY